jgi:hypothetical protein
MEERREALDIEYPNGFRTAADYRHFLSLITSSPDYERVPVTKVRSNIGGTIETWYRNVRTGRVYRLVEPDDGFRGIWYLVPEADVQP